MRTGGPAGAFAVFDAQDSGRLSYGVERAGRMRLIDLDEYRPGPFVLDADRLPGSGRYMAPEESVRGSLIDQRTTVHVLGRTLHHLLDSPTGWRGTVRERTVVDRATEADPRHRHRHRTVAELLDDWSAV